jgi:hypothetical protein
MSRIQNRREFIEAGTLTSGCVLLGCLASRVRAADETPKKSYDFDELTYCCYECKAEQCPLLEASLGNDLEYKKGEAAKWREKYQREFSFDEVFCFGCKVESGRLGFNVKSCVVRACVLGKGLVSCAHCGELAACQKPLWTNYPKFREQVLGIQKDIRG